MAEHLLGSLLLKVGTLQNLAETITYSANDYFEIYYNDSTDAITADLNGSPTTDGPVFELSKEGVTHTFSPLNYSQCHPTTSGLLLRFLPSSNFSISTFPYFSRFEIPNSNQCTGNESVPVVINSTSSTNESGVGNFDGTITVNASGGGQALKYDTKDFIYSIEGQTSSTITGLAKGNHTVWVKDGQGEQAVVTVTVGRDGDTVLSAYNDLYQVQYNTLEGHSSRVTISDRDHTGGVSVPEENQDEPFQLTYRGENDIFNPIVGSQATIGLMSKSNFQYVDLFTQDDKRYLVTWEKDTGSGFETRWKGFIQADFFSEPYTDKVYPTSVTATDGLGKLSQIDFLRDDEERFEGTISCLLALIFCLNKIGLEQGIREAINMYEDSHNTTATDSPLNQTYVNTDSYYNEAGEPVSCGEVISRILTPFGATLISANGFWYIVRVEELRGTSIDYREFDASGVYVTNGSFSPRIDLNTAQQTVRAVALKGSGNLTVTPANGRIEVVSNLLKPPTSVQGNFSEPILSGPFKIFSGFPGWSLTILNGELASSKSFEVRTENSNWWVLEGGANSIGTSRIVTPELKMTYSQTDKIKFRFKYFVVARNNFLTNQIAAPPYCRLKWSLYVATSVGGAKQWLQSDGTWTSSTTQNVIFVGEFNKELDFEIEATLPDDNSPLQGVFQVRLNMIGFRDTDDPNLSDEATVITTLKAIATTGLTGGFRYSLGTNVTNYYYVLTERNNDGLTASDEPQLVEPTDYADTTNEKIWQLESKITSSTNIFPEVKYSGVDVEYWPSSAPAPKTATVSALTQGLPRKIDKEEQIQLFHFDVPPEVNNARNIYINQFLSSDTGTATTNWTRDSEPGESRSIQNILTRVYVNQTKQPRYKVNMTFKSDVEISMLSTIRDTFDSNKIYMIRGLTINDRSEQFRITEMVEVTDGEELGAYSSAYSSAYGGQFDSINE